jgi:hypothetical protein
MGFEQVTDFDALPLSRIDHPLSHKIAQASVFHMLQITAAASGKVGTRRILVKRTSGNLASCINEVAGRSPRDVTSRRRDAVTQRRNANYRLCFWLSSTHIAWASANDVCSARS